jgi:hypothetical protein
MTTVYHVDYGIIRKRDYARIGLCKTPSLLSFVFHHRLPQSFGQDEVLSAFCRVPVCSLIYCPERGDGGGGCRVPASKGHGD